MNPVKQFVNSAKELKTIQSLAAIAMLLALRVVFGILANTTMPMLAYVGKISLSFLPIAVTAAMFGPFPAMLVGGLGDLLSWLIMPMGQPYFPGFTISGILTGLIFGLVFYGQKISLPRVIIAWFINALTVETFLAAFWFLIAGIGGTNSYGGLLLTRFISEGIKCVPEIAIIFGTGKLVELIPYRKLGRAKR